MAQMDYSQFSFCVPLSNRQIKDSVFWGQINFPLDPAKWFIIPGSAGTKRRPFFSKLIVTARKKTIIERVSPFDLDSNSNSQSAIHLSKKNLI